MDDRPNGYHPREVCEDRKGADQGVRKRHSTAQGICLLELFGRTANEKERKGRMENRFIRAEDVAAELEVSIAIIRIGGIQLGEELFQLPKPQKRRKP